MIAPGESRDMDTPVGGGLDEELKRRARTIPREGCRNSGKLNKGNVSQLRIAWRRPGIDASITANAKDLTYSNNFRATPLMIQGVLYSPNAIGLVEAFHPGTGRTIWVQQPFADEPGGGLRGDSSRGVAHWTDGK